MLKQSSSDEGCSRDPRSRQGTCTCPLQLWRRVGTAGSDQLAQKFERRAETHQSSALRLLFLLLLVLEAVQRGGLEYILVRVRLVVVIEIMRRLVRDLKRAEVSETASPRCKESACLKRDDPDIIIVDPEAP